MSCFIVFKACDALLLVKLVHTLIMLFAVVERGTCLAVLSAVSRPRPRAGAEQSSSVLLSRHMGHSALLPTGPRQSLHTARWRPL